MSRNTPLHRFDRFDASREGDWIAQAEHDLKVACSCLNQEYFDWATICAQQAAEKRIKALFHHFRIAYDKSYFNQHDLRYLSRFIPQYLVTDIDNLEKHCDTLSGVYFKKRYPDSLPSGYPADFTTRETAVEAIKSAEYIMSECERISTVISTT